MNKNIIGVVAIVAVAAAGGFYGGSKYQKSKAAMIGGAFNRQAGVQGMARRAGAGNGFLGGEVLSKDASSLTLKLPNGGSSIVFYSPSTTIEKAASGSWDDVKVGSSVTVRGTQGADGSYTAQSIQLSRMPLRLNPSTSPMGR